MRAAKLLAPLLLDIDSFKVGQMIGMLFHEKIGVTDDVVMENPALLHERRQITELRNNILERSTYYTNVGIIRSHSRSKLIDLRDACRPEDHRCMNTTRTEGYTPSS